MLQSQATQNIVTLFHLHTDILWRQLETEPRSKWEKSWRHAMETNVSRSWATSTCMCVIPASYGSNLWIPNYEMKIKLTNSASVNSWQKCIQLIT